jgi:N-dimethylarginine dimethylaminohydrolase
LFNLIPVSQKDAELLSCNAVVIGDTVIFPSGDIEILETVSNLGCNVVQVDVSEFIKAGGACQCLVISIN